MSSFENDEEHDANEDDKSGTEYETVVMRTRRRKRRKRGENEEG